MRSRLLHLSLTLFATCGAPAIAQTIIAPVDVVFDGTKTSGFRLDTINQGGLLSNYVAGVTNFDAFIATNPLHKTAAKDSEWFVGSGSNDTKRVTFDFGTSVSVDRLALWNEESRGIPLLTLLRSSDGVDFFQFANYSPTPNPVGTPYGAEVFSFDPISARYIRFEMNDCPPDDGFFYACGIGEVAFRSQSSRSGGAVPEPASWTLMIGGFGLAGAAMRRRRSVTVRYA